MKIETLVVTMDQHDHLLAEKMNLQTDAVIGNQSDLTADEAVCWQGHSVRWFSRTERGVGRNRNLVLSRATADVCVLADDDLRFVDGYPQIVRRAFEEAGDADVVVFNLLERTPARYRNKRLRRIHWYNYARYGAARLAVRRQSIEKAGLRFSTQFGGGARYGSGEDTIFLHQCLRRGLKIVAVPYAIAEVDQTARSSWFSGYNEKFFEDKGALYACLYSRWAVVLCVRYLLRYRHKYRAAVSMKDALGWMLKGAKVYRDQSKTNTAKGEEIGCGSA